MALTYTIRPVSGDQTATIWADATMTKKIGELPAGSNLTVTGSADGGFVIKNNANSGIMGYASGPTSGTVKSNSGLNARTGPGTNNSRVGAFNNGAKLTITDSQNGWYLVSGSSGWGTLSNVWVSSQYVLTDGGSEEAYVSSSDVQVSGSNGNTSSGGTDTYSQELADSQIGTVHFTNYGYTPDAGLQANTEFYKEMISKITYALGTPPKYNMDIDIQYESDVGMGRVMLNTFYSNPTLLSICPGKVKMFPNLFGEKKDTMLDALIAAASGNGDLVSKLQGDTNAHFSGKMYTFQSDTAGYAKRLNLLCRACAILLGIGDKFMPGTNKPLKSFDYAYWTIRKAYAPTAVKDTSIFNDFWNAGMDAVSGAVTDKNYIHFVLSNNETSISETMSTDVTENPLMQTLKSTVNGATSTLTYFLNSGFNEQNQDLSDVLSSALDGVVGGENGWTKLAKNLMKGGQMAFPKQISGVDFNQAVQCNLTFISPYGNPYSVFLYCVVPIMHILALALPKQVADNMYTFPFICRVCQKGWFNSNLACIGDVQISRGGQDNTSWSAEGLSTEWNVSFSIVPLYQQLMVTSTDNPFLFIKNEGLIDYLGNLCAFDLKANNLTDKINIFTSFVINKFTGIPNDAQRWISDMLAGKISDIFQF